MELLDVCLKTTCFQFEDQFCQQKVAWHWETRQHYVYGTLWPDTW
jgi:hypothetical protein